MGLLKRLKITRNEEEEEEEDEFDAEQNGLFMAATLASDAEKPRAEGEPASLPAQGEAQASQAEAAQPSPAAVDPLDVAAASPAVQTEAQQAAPQEASPEQGSDNDALSLFKASVAEQTSLLPVLKEILEDISAAELLTEARSVRDGLLGGQAGGGGERERRETA